MSHDNVEVVRRLYEAFNQRDAEAASHLWAADGEWQPAFTGGGLVEGAIGRITAGRAYTSEAAALEALGA